MYESIIRGESVTEPGVPESFKVLVRELQSLAVNVELLRERDGSSTQAMDVADDAAAQKEASLSVAEKE